MRFSHAISRISFHEDPHFLDSLMGLKNNKSWNFTSRLEGESLFSYDENRVKIVVWSSENFVELVSRSKKNRLLSLSYFFEFRNMNISVDHSVTVLFLQLPQNFRKFFHAAEHSYETFRITFCINFQIEMCAAGLATRRRRYESADFQTHLFLRSSVNWFEIFQVNVFLLRRPKRCVIHKRFEFVLKGIPRIYDRVPTEILQFLG